jgi:excisionase family DNA binding protein
VLTVASDEIACAVAAASSESLALLAKVLAGHLPKTQTESPFMTIPEASEYLRCKRQRIDDLLSARRLTRIKEGRRTLVLRSEIEAHLAPGDRRASGSIVTSPRNFNSEARPTSRGDNG